MWGKRVGRGLCRVTQRLRPPEQPPGDGRAEGEGRVWGLATQHPLEQHLGLQWGGHGSAGPPKLAPPCLCRQNPPGFPPLLAAPQWHPTFSPPQRPRPSPGGSCPRSLRRSAAERTRRGCCGRRWEQLP